MTEVLPRPAYPTVAEMLEARASDDHPGLLARDRTWSWREFVAESQRRAWLALRYQNQLPDGGRLHVGVLLDNTPEYLFWLGACALAGCVVVGINPTRRGDELARDIRFTDCGLIVTDSVSAEVLDGLDTGVPDTHLLRTDLEWEDVKKPDSPQISPHDLYLLIFTSGTTGSPKAVQCTQGRLAAIGARASEIYGFVREDVCYCPMPLFHGNAIMALWSPAMFVGAPLAMNGRFSASRFAEDVRRFKATRFTYVGKALAYVLATDERPEDSDNSLRVGFGTEASARDRSEFERRFGCKLVEGYGSSEGGVAITRTPETPPDALGIPAEGIAVLDPETATERERARIDSSGKILNPDEAIGELASLTGASMFEGYYKNPEADAKRVANGWYWTGDLAYRDEAGFVYFAGRNDDWLRVDSENFAAAPIERILERHPDVIAAAVYPVPDAQSADQVMAAIELQQETDVETFANELEAFLEAQPDLGTKWSPRFVRIVGALPLTATGKITKTSLKKERWECSDPLYWRAARHDSEYRMFGPEDAADLREEFERHGRSAVLL